MNYIEIYISVNLIGFKRANRHFRKSLWFNPWKFWHCRI